MGMFDNVDVQVNGPAAISKTLATYTTVILKPNVIDTRNVLTQSMMSSRNTKYVIKWNYVLDSDIIIPDGCLIEFDGGSIANEEGKNFTLTGDNTTLIYNQSIDDVIKDVQLLGTFDYGIHAEADEEDITEVHDKLKFADKDYDAENFSGLGRVYLRKNIVDGKNILTSEAVNKPNTIYVIQYDFDLNGAEITIPEGCVLKFEGGSLRNGTLHTNECEVYSSHRCFYNVVTDQTVINPTLYGVSPTNEDNDYTLLTEYTPNARSYNFESAIYKSSRTFNLGSYNEETGEIIHYSPNIVGKPSFRLVSTEDIPVCVFVCRDNIIDIDAISTDSRTTPSEYNTAKWDNQNNIGMMAIQWYHVRCSIKTISRCAQGFMCYADNGGFAWNSMDILQIDAAQHSFVIKSKNRGWLNANELSNMTCIFNTGTAVGGSGTYDQITVISDGEYPTQGGWAFYNVAIELHSNNVLGLPAYFLNLNTGNGASLEGKFYGSRIELQNATMMYVDDTATSKIEIDYSLLMNTSSHYVLNQDGDYNCRYGVLSLLEYTEIEDNKNDVILNSGISYGKYYCTASLIHNSSHQEFSTYYNYSCRVLRVHRGDYIRVLGTGGLEVQFANSEMLKVSDLAGLIRIYGNGCRLVQYSPYDYLTKNTDNATISIKVLSDDISYMYLMYLPSYNAEFVVEMNGSAEMVSMFPYDMFHTSLAKGAVRTNVLADTALRYGDGTIDYFRTSGSIGTTTAKASCDAGSTLLNVTDNNIYVDDIISINGTKYKVIARTNTTITIDGTVEGALVEAPIEFVQPEYLNIDDAIRGGVGDTLPVNHVDGYEFFFTPTNTKLVFHDGFWYTCDGDKVNVTQTSVAVKSPMKYYTPQGLKGDGTKTAYMILIPEGMRDKDVLVVSAFLNLKVYESISYPSSFFGSDEVPDAQICNNIIDPGADEGRHEVGSTYHIPSNATALYVSRSGDYRELPPVLLLFEVEQKQGSMKFDTATNKPLWWDGTNWVDATGQVVS